MIAAVFKSSLFSAHFSMLSLPLFYGNNLFTLDHKIGIRRFNNLYTLLLSRSCTTFLVCLSFFMMLSLSPAELPSVVIPSDVDGSGLILENFERLSRNCNGILKFLSSQFYRWFCGYGRFSVYSCMLPKQNHAVAN